MRLAVGTVFLIAALVFLAFGLPRFAFADSRFAIADSPPKQVSALEQTYQGRPLRWWVRRTVRARKDANARGRTIRRLQSITRGKLAMPTGHWLDGAFLCIHRFEGSWQDDGLPYFGGLQMDPPFVRAHAPAWVIAAFGSNPARWPAAVQITVGINAWTTRGFGPWPTTRHFCGL